MSNEESYEKDMLDFDDDADIDIKKINPLLYIHYAILASQKTLMVSVMKPGGFKDGILAYKIFIEQIEVISRSANYLTAEYTDAIKNFINSDDYKTEKDSFVQLAKLSNKKLELLLQAVFKRSPSTDTLKLG